MEREVERLDEDFSQEPMTFSTSIRFHYRFHCPNINDCKQSKTLVSGEFNQCC